MQTSFHDPAPGSRDAFAAAYRAHHDFVRRTLRHLGVDADRLDDALQDTFLVVYRRLGEFEGRAALRTWIFEIARRVAGRYRRTAAREAPRRCELPEVQSAAHLEDDLARAEAAEILREFLEHLDPDKSVIFVMAELEQRRAPEIAETLELNLNTVYARLRAARQQLERLVHRLQAREDRPRFRRAAEVVAAALLAGLPATASAWPSGHAGGAAAGGAALSGGAAKAAALSALPGVGGLKAIAAGLAVFGALAIGAAKLPERASATQHERPASPRMSGGTGATETSPASAPGDAAQAPAGEVPEETVPASLAQELALLEPARAALLAGDARAALRLLARHRVRFPDGDLAEEVAATQIEALCRLGETDRARRETLEFTRRWPASALAAGVGSLCGAPRPE